MVEDRARDAQRGRDHGQGSPFSQQQAATIGLRMCCLAPSLSQLAHAHGIMATEVRKGVEQVEQVSLPMPLQVPHPVCPDPLHVDK